VKLTTYTVTVQHPPGWVAEEVADQVFEEAFNLQHGEPDAGTYIVAVTTETTVDHPDQLTGRPSPVVLIDRLDAHLEGTTWDACWHNTGGECMAILISAHDHPAEMVIIDREGNYSPDELHQPTSGRYYCGSYIDPSEGPADHHRFVDDDADLVGIALLWVEAVEVGEPLPGGWQPDEAAYEPCPDCAGLVDYDPATDRYTHITQPATRCHLHPTT